MFEYLSNAPTPQAISAAYYAIRLIRHRPDIKDVLSAVSKIAESSAEEQKLVLEVLKEIEGTEQSPLEDLSDVVAENYMLKLAQIAQERSRQEVQQAGVTIERADELLNELVQTQMAERELPGLRGSKDGQLGETIVSGEMYTRELHEQERWDPVGRDYSGRHERYGSGRERSRDAYGYEWRRYRYDEEPHREEHGFSHSGRYMSDERLTHEIITRFEEHLGREARNIQVYVSNGKVVLTGTVYDRRLSRIAEDIAESIAGAENVRNLLRVGEQGFYRDRYYDYGSAPRYGSGLMYRGERRVDDDEEDERGRFYGYGSAPRYGSSGLMYQGERRIDDDEEDERGRYYDYGSVPRYGSSGLMYRGKRRINDDEEDERDRYRKRY